MGLKLFSNPFLLNSFRNGARSQLTDNEYAIDESVLKKSNISIEEEAKLTLVWQTALKKGQFQCTYPELEKQTDD